MAAVTPITQARRAAAPRPFRPPPPLPPRWAEREPPPPPTPLARFVLLSVLLHVLLILLFGAPGGGSREGRALWGSLNVVLQPRPAEAGPALKMATELSGPPASSAPAASRPVAPAPSRPAAPPSESPYVVPPVLDRLEPYKPLPDLPAPAQVPPPTELQAPVARPLERVIAPDVAAPLQPAPRIPEPLQLDPSQAQPIPRLDMPRASPPLAAPPAVEFEALPVLPRVQAPRVAKPLADPQLEFAPPPVIPAPMPGIQAPRVERSLVEPPRVEFEPLPTLPRIQAPRITRPLVEPPGLEAVPVPAPPVERSPLEAPTVPATRAEPTSPGRDAPASPGRAEPASPPAPDRADAPPTARERPAPGGPTREPRSGAPSPFQVLPPQARDPQKPAAEQALQAAPSLDMEALRKRAGQIAREGTGNRAAFPFPMPPAAKPKTKMEAAIENARKPDCRTAYQDLGLLAMLPLIANEFGEGRCRW